MKGLNGLYKAKMVSLACAIAAACSTRRIITRGVIDMATSEVLESESFLYSGPVAKASALGRPILTTAQLQNHLTQVGAISDVIWAPLYDANSYAAAGQLQLNFFSTPQGQGTTTAPGGSGVKTLADTNMTAAGQLTMGNDFYMTGQEILFFPGENPGVQETGTAIGNFINDTYAVSKSGVLTLTIGSNRQYIQDGPLGQFPPLTRLAVASAVAGTGAASTNTNEVTYAVFAGTPYSITPVYITATLGFQEVITWPAKVTVANAAVIYSRLDGYLIRNAQ